MTPGMQDAGPGQACLTNDGIVLKEERSSWGKKQVDVGPRSRLTRRAISFSIEI